MYATVVSGLKDREPDLKRNGESVHSHGRSIGVSDERSFEAQSAEGKLRTSGDSARFSNHKNLPIFTPSNFWCDVIRDSTDCML